MHPDRARPSMEACGINVFATARVPGHGEGSARYLRAYHGEGLIVPDHPEQKGPR
jgi:hypothetical protein